MEIEVIRFKKGANTALGRFILDDDHSYYNLEDTDRGLIGTMPIKQIAALKKKGVTAIPIGRYQVLITYSNRFKKLLPILLNVPGYEGIRIHPGNKHQDTEGCLLPGMAYQKIGNDYQVLSSRIAFDQIFASIQGKIKSGKEVWCTISNAYSDEIT